MGKATFCTEVLHWVICKHLLISPDTISANFNAWKRHTNGRVPEHTREKIKFLLDWELQESEMFERSRSAVCWFAHVQFVLWSRVWECGNWWFCFLWNSTITQKKHLFAFLTIKNHKKCYSQFRGSLGNICWVPVWQQALEASPVSCAVRLWPAPHTGIPWGFPLHPFTEVQLECLVWSLWIGWRRAQSPQETQVPHLVGGGSCQAAHPGSAQS